jgi:hypothetical protein
MVSWIFFRDEVFSYPRLITHRFILPKYLEIFSLFPSKRSYRVVACWVSVYSSSMSVMGLPHVSRRCHHHQVVVCREYLIHNVCKVLLMMVIMCGECCYKVFIAHPYHPSEGWMFTINVTCIKIVYIYSI